MPDRSPSRAAAMDPTVMQAPDYRTFTLALEGAQPYGAHNLVHMWFNGTMSQVPIAPADPMFWMHHAEIDRLWWITEQSHPGQVPSLSGADAVLDPWPENVSDVLNINSVVIPTHTIAHNCDPLSVGRDSREAASLKIAERCDGIDRIHAV